MADRSTLKIGIVTPMANEAGEAVAFVEAVLAQSRGFQSVRHFIVLDRVCQDNTRDILEEFAKTEPELAVIWAPENRCVVDAYVRGYREALAAGCDWILEIDAGFSHQPGDIPQFYDLMETGGYDCLFGSRFMPGGKIADSSKMRHLTSWGGTLLSNLLLGTKLKDMTSGFELFSRETLEKVLARGIQSRGPFFQTEIRYHCRDLRIREVPIHYRSASHQVGSKACWDALTNLHRLFHDKTPALY